MGSRFEDCPNLRLGAIAEVGPAGRWTMDAFTKSDSPGGNSERALWQHKTTVTQSMSAQPDSGITGVPGKAEMAAKYWRQRGRFLCPKWTTAQCGGNRIWRDALRWGCKSGVGRQFGSIWRRSRR